MSSSPDLGYPSARVLLAEHTAALPLASLISAQSLGLAFGHLQAEPDEEEVVAKIAAAYEAGHQVGMEEATTAEVLLRRERLAECAHQVNQAACAIAKNRDAMLEQIVAESVDLAFGLLRELVGTELSLHEQPAREAVLRALQLTPPDNDLLIRVHPDSELDPEEFAALVPAAGVSVVHDLAVERTGAIVEIGACRIDAQVGPALERVREILRSEFAHDTADE